MKLSEYIKEHILLMDGAMGTYYQQQPEHKEEISELASVSQPDLILRIHKEYLEAGADLIRTNTFAVNSVVLPQQTIESREQLLRLSCRLAKQAVQEEKERTGRECFVAADIGPISVYKETMLRTSIESEGSRSTEDNIRKEYFRMCDIFIEEGMDIFWLETFFSTEYVAEILSYIKEKVPDSFCSVSFCINKNGYTTAGQKAERLLFSEVVAQADAVGFNCGIGPVHLKSVLSGCAFPKEKYIVAAPNAGYAEVYSGRAAFLNTAGYFGGNVSEIVKLGVDIVGGCCGTMPSFIREIKKRFDKNIIAEEKEKNKTQDATKTLLRIPTEEYNRREEAKKSDGKELTGENRFKSKLLSGEKVIAVELDPPYDANGEKILMCAQKLSKYPVDVLTFADSPMGRSRADSVLTALHIRQQTGLQVIPHISCRDRNVIAMRSMILGAHMNGLKNLLIVTGDPVPGDERKTVTGVFDYNSIRFMEYVTGMNEELFQEDAMFFGGALNYNYPNAEKVAERMEKKMAAGCDFFLTQPIFSEEDVERIAWLSKRTGARILGGILPPVSLKNALFIKNEMAGMNVPEEVLALYHADMTREEGEQTGAQVAKQVMKALEPYVAGYYFMLPFNRVGLIERIFTE